MINDIQVIEISRDNGIFHVDEMEYTNRYYACMVKAKLVVYLHLQTHISLDFVQLHLTIINWGVSTARAMREGFEKLVKPIIRDMGLHRIIGVKTSEIEKWEKLMLYLGFATRLLPDGSKLIEMEV